jgi:hypothetical protein
MAQVLSDDGYLLLGASEMVVGVTTSFVPHESARGISVKKLAAAPAGRVMPPSVKAVSA